MLNDGEFGVIFIGATIFVLGFVLNGILAIFFGLGMLVAQGANILYNELNMKHKDDYNEQ